MNLSASLKEVGLELGRLKTGTPPRLLRRSLDFSKTEIQPGDEPVPYFTFWKEELFHVEQSRIKPPNFARSGGKYPPGSILDRINGQLPCYVTFSPFDRSCEPSQVPDVLWGDRRHRAALLPIHRGQNRKIRR
jgi:tRNA uridine 5-carboxymethylaminomethyl modification enzyme